LGGWISKVANKNAFTGQLLHQQYFITGFVKDCALINKTERWIAPAAL
jgi:hypothetical protein